MERKKICLLSTVLILGILGLIIENTLVYFDWEIHLYIQMMKMDETLEHITPNPKPHSKYIITSLNYGSPYKQQGYKVIANQKCYAIRHNYTFKLFTEKNLKHIEFNYFNSNVSFCDKGRNRAYYKAFVLNHIFNHNSFEYTFDYVLFVDHDVLFTNHNVSLDHILSKSYQLNKHIFRSNFNISNMSNQSNPVSFVWSRRGALINSGVLLFKNTKMIQNLIGLLYNITIDICVNHIEWSGNNFMDQTIFNFILKGLRYQDWEKKVLNNLNDNSTKYMKQWGSDCINSKSMSRSISNANVMKNCVHRSFHPYIAILDSGLFNCIGTYGNGCKQFVVHFAGTPGQKKRQYIDQTFDQSPSCTEINLTYTDNNSFPLT